MRLTQAFVLSVTVLSSLSSALSLEKKSFLAARSLYSHDWARDIGSMQKRHKSPHSGEGGPPQSGPPQSGGGPPPQSGGGPPQSGGGPPQSGGKPPKSGGGPPQSGGGPPQSGGGGPSPSGDYPCQTDDDCKGKHLKSDNGCANEENSTFHCGTSKTCYFLVRNESALSYCQCMIKDHQWVDACVLGPKVNCIDVCSATNTQLCEPGHNPCKGESS